jgi:hypothetical protein
MLVEALWRWLREDVTYQHCHASLDGLETSVAGFQDEGFKAQVTPYIERIPLEEECDGQDLSVL